MNVHSACRASRIMPQKLQGSKEPMGVEMVAVQHEKDGRARIMDAARTLFSSNGFHHTSMAQLATAAQVSVGQIYRLFKGKEDVIEALVQADADAWTVKMIALRTRLDASELTIEQTFEQMLLHTTEEKDEAQVFSLKGLAPSKRASAKKSRGKCAGTQSTMTPMPRWCRWSTKYMKSCGVPYRAVGAK